MWVWRKQFLKQNLGIWEIVSSVASWGIELMSLANPIFEFHVIIGSGTNVFHQAKETNL